MRINKLILHTNEKTLRLAARKDIRPHNMLIIWVKMPDGWEMYDFSITRWPQYLEAHYIYCCCLMRENIQDIRLGLCPASDEPSDYPPMVSQYLLDQCTTRGPQKGRLFSREYSLGKGF